MKYNLPRVELFFPFLRLKTTLLVVAVLLAGHSGFSQDLYINEIVSIGDGSYPDEDGDTSDWIEIYNPGTETIQLSGYGISDDSEDLFQWTFPQFSLAPAEFLVVFCSNKNRYSNPFHTNFKLKSSGEQLILSSPSGEIIDNISPTPLSEGFALAKVCIEACYWEILDTTTPGLANSSGSIIAFSSPSGVFQNEIEVSISHSLGHDIRYTLDGSVPISESPLYDGPITFVEPLGSELQLSTISTSPLWTAPTGAVLQINNIRAMSFVENNPSSRVFSKTYSVGQEAYDLFSEYPVFSFQTDADSLFDPDYGIYVPGVNYVSSNSQWTGNYFMRGVEWERDVHIEYFENAVPVWSQSAGVRIHGGKTRGSPQKSLRLYARDYLGAGEFNHPFFETKDKEIFDKLLLRCVFGCWNKTAIKDEVSAYVAKDLNFDSQHSRPCVLFINGEYWGLFSIRDYLDAQYIEEAHGFHKDSVDILNHGSGFRPDAAADWGIYEGDNLQYVALMDFMENADMTVTENYEFISTQMDMSSMIDYYCTEIFFAQKDWPAGNHKVWRGGDDEKWKWLLFDMDSGWGFLGPSNNAMQRVTSTSSSNYSNPPWATFLFRKFLESPQFVINFKSRYACLMKNEFEAETVGQAIDRFVEIYTPGMPRNIDRWHNNSSMENWISRVNSELVDFSNERTAYAVENITNFFNVEFDLENYDCPNIVSNTDEGDALGIQMIIYPNPSSDKIWIDSNIHDTGMVRIFDSMGRLVYTDDYQFHKSIGIEHFSQGIYIAMIEVDGKRYSKQFVKN